MFALGASPIGTLGSAVRNGLVADVSGWSMDTDTGDPILVDIWLNGRLQHDLRADQPRLDVGAAYPNYGPNHGYSGKVTLRPGENQDLVRTGSTSASARIVCWGAKQRHHAGVQPDRRRGTRPYGPGVVLVRGWALDPDTPASIHVDVCVNDRWVATVPRTRTARTWRCATPASGRRTGSTNGTAPAGLKKVCVYGLNVGGGSHKPPERVQLSQWEAI